jgi:hypothetical protein
VPVLQPASLVMVAPEADFIPPKREGTRVIRVAVQFGQSDGEGLSMERSQASKRWPHCSHLYS